MSRILEDVQTQIFTQYLGLIQEALQEGDVPELEKFWAMADKLGSRGVIMKTVINEGTEKVVEQLLAEKEIRTPFVLRPPYQFATLVRLFYTEDFYTALEEKDFVSLRKLLQKDVEFAEVLEIELRGMDRRSGDYDEKYTTQELTQLLYLLLEEATFLVGIESFLPFVLQILEHPANLLEGDNAKALQNALAEKILVHNNKAVLSLLQQAKYKPGLGRFFKQLDL